MSYNTPNGYYDRFNPETKDWKKLLFTPDKPVQAAELNEIQSVVNYEHAQLASSFYKEGAAVEGLSIIVTASTSYPEYATDTVYHVRDHVKYLGIGYQCIVEHTSGSILPTDITYWVVSVGYASITAGKIYAQGFMHKIPSDELEVSLTGEESIGVLLLPRVITHAVDSSLTDPAVGYEGYQYVGADRLAYSYSYTLNNPLSVVIAILSSGQLDQTYLQIRPVIDPMLKIMAKRTTDQSGSYSVDKYALEFSDLDSSDFNYATKLKLVLRGGSSYVNGWYTKNSVYDQLIDRAISTSTVYNEPNLFLNTDKIYTLSTSPVLSVSLCTGTIDATVQLTRTLPMNSLDSIPQNYTPVLSISSIVQGATTYVEGTDYLLSNNAVSWTPGGNEPSIGTVYTVNFQYIKTLTKGVRTLTKVTAGSVTRGVVSGSSSYDVITTNIQSTIYSQLRQITKVYQGNTEYYLGTDYTVSEFNGRIYWNSGHGPSLGQTYYVDMSYWDHTVEGDFISRDSFITTNNSVPTPVYYDLPTKTPSGLDINYSAAISFDVYSSDIPNDSTYIYTIYDYCLPRTDVLAVDYKGFIFYIKGVSAQSPNVPSLSDSQMSIATVYQTADGFSDSVKIKFTDNQRLTMLDLRTMLRMIKDIQYNEAVFQLHQDTVNKNLPTDKKAVWADNFKTPLFGDLTHPEFDITYEFIYGSIGLPHNEEYVDLSAQVSTTAVNVANYFMIPYTETLFMVQPYATQSIQVNAYTRVNLGPRLSADPAVDKWVETINTTIEVQGQTITLPPKFIKNKKVLYTDHGLGGGWVGDHIPKKGDLLVDINGKKWGFGPINWDWGSPSLLKTTSTSSTTTTTDSWDDTSNSIQVVPIPNARATLVTLTGSNWIPNEDNIAIYFDGTKLNDVTPIAPSTLGANRGTITADITGAMSGSFVIPAGTKTGQHNIAAIGEGTTEGAGSRATTSYYADGKLQTVTTYITHNTVISSTTTTTDTDWYHLTMDPVAQTFIATKSTFLTKIELFFSAKPSDNGLPVLVDLRTTVNGIPGQDVLGTSLPYNPQDVSVSTDGTVATTFIFDHPVYVEKDKEYCFVVKSDSEQYSIFISKTGDYDPINGWVNSNPNTGVLLTSANLMTWSPIQNADIKFALYNTLFSSSSSKIDYGVVTWMRNTVSWTDIFATFGVPTKDTRVRFQYSLDNVQWVDFPPIVETFFSQITDKTYYRALLETSDMFVSPVVYNDAYATGYDWMLNGKYVSREVTTNADNSRYAHVWIDAANLAGVTTVVPSIRVNGVDQLMTEVVDDLVDYGDGWKEVHYMYDNTVGFSAATLKISITSSDYTVSPRISRARMIFSGL